MNVAPDADDTSVNIMVGSLLKRYTSNSTYYARWLKDNPHISTAIKTIMQYTYQPFGNTINNSLVDSQTYFYLRNFLYHNKELGNTDLKLPYIWLINTPSSITTFDKGVRLLYNVNSVGLVIIVNVLYSLTAGVLSEMDNPDTWFDDDVQSLYSDCVDHVIYEVQTNFSSRPDLALAYYTAQYSAYWLMARTLQILRASDGQLKYSVMKKASQDLESLLRNDVTDTLLKLANHDESGLIYYDDFIGVGDVDSSGKIIAYQYV